MKRAKTKAGERLKGLVRTYAKSCVMVSNAARGVEDAYRNGEPSGPGSLHAAHTWYNQMLKQEEKAEERLMAEINRLTAVPTEGGDRRATFA